MRMTFLLDRLVLFSFTGPILNRKPFQMSIGPKTNFPVFERAWSVLEYKDFFPADEG